MLRTLFRLCVSPWPLCLGVLVVLAWAVSARAHPHVFVTPTLTVVFDQEGLVGFRQKWVFDEMFSVMILDEYDQDGDQRLGRDEIAAIKAGAFDAIREWNYFTYISVAGEPFQARSITDFTARVEHGSLVYEFFVSCRVAAAQAAKTVVVSVFDPDYYTDFLPPLQEEVVLEGTDGFRVELDVRQDPGAVFSEWLITPTVASVRFSRP